jgi:hypothetical protein
VKAPAIVLTVVLAACTETHDGTQAALTPDSCLACHTAGSGSNVLVHPENLFPLMSGGTVHNNINCQNCHWFSVGPGLLGYHADCTSVCHLQSRQSQACAQYPQSNGMPCMAIEPFHQGLVNPNPPGQAYAWDSVNKDFCTQCHPSGL